MTLKSSLSHDLAMYTGRGNRIIIFGYECKDRHPTTISRSKYTNSASSRTYIHMEAYENGERNGNSDPSGKDAMVRYPLPKPFRELQTNFLTCLWGLSA